MTAAWGGIGCSKPPCVAISLRRTTYSYASIEARKAFTISIPSEAQVKMADFVGMKSGRNLDKFAVCHLNPVRSALVDEPYVAETPLILDCCLIQTLEIGLHTLFVEPRAEDRSDEMEFFKRRSRDTPGKKASMPEPTSPRRCVVPSFRPRLMTLPSGFWQALGPVPSSPIGAAGRILRYRSKSPER